MDLTMVSEHNWILVLIFSVATEKLKQKKIPSRGIPETLIRKVGKEHTPEGLGLAGNMRRRKVAPVPLDPDGHPSGASGRRTHPLGGKEKISKKKEGKRKNSPATLFAGKGHHHRAV